MQHVVNIDLTHFTQSLSRLRQNRANKRKALSRGGGEGGGGGRGEGDCEISQISKWKDFQRWRVGIQARYQAHVCWWPFFKLA